MDPDGSGGEKELGPWKNKVEKTVINTLHRKIPVSNKIKK